MSGCRAVPSGGDKNDDGTPSTFYSLHQDKRQIARLSPDGAGTRAASDFATLLFENERVRVSDFRLPPGRSAEIRHGRPTVRWQVDGGRHRLEVVRSDGKPGTVLEESVPDRRVHYVESGTTWKLRNVAPETDEKEAGGAPTGGGGAYRQILFELLSEEPRYTEEEVMALFARAKYSTDVGTALLFENRLCRVWDFYLEPGQGGGDDTVHHHCLDYVFVNVAPSRLLGLRPDSLSLDDLLFDSVSRDNDVTWNSIPEGAASDAAYAHGGKNGYDDRPMREYLVELK